MLTGRYQLFPRLDGYELVALRQDIAERGVLVPVELDESGIILDGHHRVEIATELGIEYPIVVREGLTEDEKVDHVVLLNLARRNLSGHDRTGVIARLRARGMSLRAIAMLTGVSHETARRDLAVTNVTCELEQAPDPEPLPMEAQPTITERAKEMEAAGLTQRAIADALGVSPGTVHNVLRGRTDRKARMDTPVDWPATRAFVKGLGSFASRDPRQVAAAIPDRNRKSTADQLRRYGTFLGSIALELERSAR